jgi:Tol biopolymer transport system component/tRNA A-37 threonylcarbamoyl transferase component Bud32
MSLKPGTMLGTYELIAMIGAGGMGEVYKARDSKLNRLVAIKVLPASLAADAALLARFDREAKAVAALSHPNVLGIFDLATQDGLTYAVMELLEGESLRDKLKGGALPPKRAIEIATELAQGLGAAHERGIVHRDVKPENIFLTREGRVKVLDFGLAKQVSTPRGVTSTVDTAALGQHPQGTEAGMILGTVGYMSPEQVRGEAADHRADVFAFGVVLYEMLSGQRPFHGETSVQTMSAILDEEPRELTSSRGPLPPALERLVNHCLEKQPEARFQSMKDVAYNLQNLSTVSSDSAGKAKALRPQRLSPLQISLGAAATLILIGLLWAFHLPPFARPAQPIFTRVTHTPGTIEAAFFGPDGKTVYFSERIKGAQPELFVLHPGSPEPKPLGIKDALLLGVSPTGDLAILREPKGFFGAMYRGMLAQVNGGGGSVKEIQENVVHAAWDGAGFVTDTAPSWQRFKVEFGGRVLLEGDPGTVSVRFLRLSPDGARLAMVVSDAVSKTEIVSFDRSGQRSVHFTKVGDSLGDTFTGLAWSPDGDLLFSELQGDQTGVWSLSLKGARRLLWRGQGTQALMDVSKEGRLLLAHQEVRRNVLVQKAREAQAMDVSIASGTQAYGFSADGKALLLLECPVQDGGTVQDLAYLWSPGGAPATRVAKGSPQSLSPDGRWANLQINGFDPASLDPALTAAFREAGLDPRKVLDPVAPGFYLLFVPTGAGRPFVLALPKSIENLGTALLTPDGKRVVFIADEKGETHWYVMDRQGGTPKAISSPEYGVSTIGSFLSPDGSRLIIYDGVRYAIQSLAGGEAQPIRGLLAGERVFAWGRDGKSVFVRKGLLSFTVDRLDLEIGARHPVFAFSPSDLSGLVNVRSVHTIPEGNLFAMSCVRKLSDLYLVEGVK